LKCKGSKGKSIINWLVSCEQIKTDEMCIDFVDQQDSAFTICGKKNPCKLSMMMMITKKKKSQDVNLSHRVTRVHLFKLSSKYFRWSAFITINKI